VERAEKIDPDAKHMWRNALRFSAVGLEMGVAVTIGYGAGWWLDKTFGTKPYLTMVMLLFGIAAGFMTIVRAAKELNKMDRASQKDQKDQKDQKGGDES
jgi:ATP synthase protein I